MVCTSGARQIHRPTRCALNRGSPDVDAGHEMPRKVDGKDASRIGKVARIDPAMVRLNRGSAEGETESQTCSIGAALLERTEQFVGVAARKAAAFVLDLDQDALG